MATQWIDFDKAVNGDVQKYTVEVAKKALAQAQAADPDGWSKYKTIVDGRHNAAPETVKPGGRIEYQQNDIGQIVEWIWLELIKRSPVVSGRYQDSHVVFINGVQVPDITRYKPGDRVQFANTQPYARKVEGGGNASGPSTRPLSPLAPNGVYRAVFRAARRKWGKAAFLKFEWQRLNLGVQVMAIQGGNGNKKRVKKDMVYPTISVHQSKPNSTA